MRNTNYTVVEYVWTPRSKARVIHGKRDVGLADLPEWNYDGSSTGQAPGFDSEVMIRPCALFKDPFRGDNHLLVMCDAYTPRGMAIKTNTRNPAKVTFEKDPSLVPWFGIEQEYTLFKEGAPLGWPHCTARSFGGPITQLGFPGPQGPYYCSAGSDTAFGREIIEEHMFMCLKAGILLSGTNAEVLPGQWEYQVGPCVGIDSGDHMWMSRYILLRVCEKYGVVPCFEPKPILGDWNGSGCHTNFSTLPMREEKNSLDKIIIPYMKKLEAKHKEHIACYGSGNEKRLTGKHETASMTKFSYGIANRGASVRIPNATAIAKRGYFEDRRPASNMDPYLVTGLIFDTCCVLGNDLRPRRSLLKRTSISTLMAGMMPLLTAGGSLKSPRLTLLNGAAFIEPLRVYTNLRTPEEYASSRFFGKAKIKARFYRHESTPIITSLTKSNNAVFKKNALEMNKMLLTWTVEGKYAKSRELAAMALLTQGSKDAALADEIFCQIVKHLTDNPSKDSTTRGLDLLALACTYLVPGIEMEPCLNETINLQDVRWRELLLSLRSEAKKRDSPLTIPTDAAGVKKAVDEVRSKL